MSRPDDESFASYRFEPLRAGSSYKTIGEMAAKHGVSLRTLRFYEQRGLLTPRRSRHYRLYGPDDEVRLKLVLTGRRLGFTLEEIKLLITDRWSDAGRLVQSSLSSLLSRDEIAGRISQLEEQRSQVENALTDLRVRLAPG